MQHEVTLYAFVFVIFKVQADVIEFNFYPKDTGVFHEDFPLSDVELLAEYQICVVTTRSHREDPAKQLFCLLIYKPLRHILRKVNCDLGFSIISVS